MGVIAQRYLGVLQEFSATIRVTRAPLLLAGLSFLILSTPDQVLELYLLLARNWARFWPHVLLALGSLAALSVFITLVSRGLIRADEDANLSRRAQTVPGAIVRVLPAFLGILPLLGAALGLYSALQSTLTESLVRSVAIFDAVKSPTALEQTVRSITSIPDVDAKIQALFPDGNGPRYSRPDPEQLGALGRVVLESVPLAILDLPQKTKALTVTIYSASALCLLFAVVLLAVSLRPRTAAALDGIARSRLFHPALLLLFAVAFLALTALFAAQSVSVGRDTGYDFTAIPRALGTLTLVNLCLIFLIFLCSVLTRTSDRLRIPLISPLIAIALLASFLDLNDNHAVRLIESSGADLAKRRIGGKDKLPPAAVDAFNAWFASRPADYKAKFADKPYPIYIVAAQGGGMYAANLSGLFLARLYDRCPLIRHHVFAVSGVSGGSVGAGFFAALLNGPAETTSTDTCDLDLPADGKPHPKGPLETKMAALLQTDFLAPVAASFLFPDLLQRFIPVPIAALDRARAFEAGLESAWDAIMKLKANPLRQPFWQHWRPDGDAPMLLLNTTVVESGRQVAAAPVELKPFSQEASPDLQSLQTALRFPVELDVPLSTAMSLSARFPIVMPAGLVRSGTQSFHLVDGGYFENSAVASAIAVIDLLRGAVCASTDGECMSKTPMSPGATNTTFHFKVFALTDYDPTPDYHGDRRNAGGGLNEVLSPVRAMFNSRVARGELAVGRMMASKDTQITAGWASLSHRIYNLPLGWQLSPQVQEIISAQVAMDCSWGKEVYEFLDAFTTISWIDAGLEIVDAAKNKRQPRAYRATPLGQMLATLKISHCAARQMLINDKVWLPPI